MSRTQSVNKNSIKKLLDKLIAFIDRINAHFTSPQKRVHLNTIQEENGLPKLFPVKLAKTRWLSLDQSLARVIEIWKSLLIYFEEKIKLIKA